MTSRSRDRRGILALLLMCLLLSSLVMLPGIGRVEAAPLSIQRANIGLDTRPTQAISLARIAVVRVLVYYIGMLNNDPAPIPVLSPCAADGVLVGTIGTNLNSFSYVLTPTSAVNPVKPCEGVQAAFQQLNGAASGWSIDHIDVVLNAAYTGIGSNQVDSIVYHIYPAEVASNAGPTAPLLEALPLSVPSGSPTHDLPVLSTPEPSDPPPNSAAATVLDITNVNGTPLARDSETFDEVKSDLYPIAVPAAQINEAPPAVPTTPPTVTPPELTVTGGTAEATATQAPAVVSTPLPLSTQVSLGAPEIDSNGRLIGMVVDDNQGNHVLTSLAPVNQAIGPITGKPGPLMTEWAQGLASYYATPPQYSQSTEFFHSLLATYPDFGGVTPFLTASQAKSVTIPSLTEGLGANNQSSSPPSTTTAGPMTVMILLGLGALALLLIIVALLFMQRRRRSKREAGTVYVVPEDEAQLDLLPPNLPLEDLDKYQLPLLSEEETIPLPSLSIGSSALEEQPTFKLPAPPVAAARSRQGTALMPHPAGLSHPGIKRAAEPNQDSIFAVQGIRIVAGRAQPFGVFIVADGMGGHLNGQEASRLSIELMATEVLQSINGSQPLDDATIRSLLVNSVQHASSRLRDSNVSQRLDMGTTITAALVVDDMAYVVNVGDSRTYLMNPDIGLQQITTDHSVVASLVSAGVIRPEEIYTHPRRNQIYRSLGGEQDSVEADTFDVPLHAGDKLLLCSDGLWEMVRDPQIEHILRGTADPQQAVELLVREANTNGGEDNISVIVVRMLEDVPEHAQQGLRVVVAPQESNPMPT